MPQGVDAPLGFKFYHALLNRNQGVLQLLNPVELTCWPRCYGAGLCSPRFADLLHYLLWSSRKTTNLQGISLDVPNATHPLSMFLRPAQTEIT